MQHRGGVPAVDRDRHVPVAVLVEHDVARPRVGELALRDGIDALPGQVQLDLPQARFEDDRIDATMLYVDSFGNIALNLTRDDIDRARLSPGSRVELELSGERYYAVMARTFADARPGDVILYEDSYRNMSVAINRGNAASMLHASPGRPLVIRVLG